MKDENRVLLEDLSDKLKRVLEATNSLSKVPAQLKAIESRLERVEGQTELLPSVMAAITDQTHQLNDHETRLTTLEQAA